MKSKTNLLELRKDKKRKLRKSQEIIYLKVLFWDIIDKYFKILLIIDLVLHYKLIDKIKISIIFYIFFLILFDTLL